MSETKDWELRTVSWKWRTKPRFLKINLKIPIMITKQDQASSVIEAITNQIKSWWEDRSKIVDPKFLSGTRQWTLKLLTSVIRDLIVTWSMILMREPSLEHSSFPTTTSVRWAPQSQILRSTIWIYMDPNHYKLWNNLTLFSHRGLFWFHIDPMKV